MKLVVAFLLASLLAVPAAFAEDVPHQRQKSHAFKQALLQQFDRDGDGRLNPRERMRAARVLARIQQKLAGRGQRNPMRAQQGGMREQRMQRFEQRRLRREQRMQGEPRDLGGQRDPGGDTGGDTQVDVYVR
jgi:hypothetical protein